VLHECAAQNAPLYDVNHSYCSRGSRTSDAHIGRGRSRTITTNRSSAQGGFNAVNLSNMYFDKDDSKIHTLRWTITDEFLDTKLGALAIDQEQLGDLVLAEVSALKTIRNVYADCYDKDSKKKRRDERREVQPVVQLFLQELLVNLRSRFSIERTTAAANATTLQASFQLNEMNRDNDPLQRRTVEESGEADIFVLRGNVDDAIDICYGIGNVETVVEIKPPFGALHHTEHRAGIDQLTCELEGLAQTLPAEPVTLKGCITDLFVISLQMRVMKEGKVYHCTSSRIVDAQQYIKHLIVICCSDITVDDMEECIRVSEGFKISDGDGEVVNDNGNVDAADDHSVTNESKGDCENYGKGSGYNTRSRKRACHTPRKHSMFRQEEDEEIRVENLQMLMDRDAQIRGLRVLREIDINTLSSR
jgi:hypothetical protein